VDKLTAALSTEWMDTNKKLHQMVPADLQEEHRVWSEVAKWLLQYKDDEQTLFKQLGGLENDEKERIALGFRWAEQ
jgi:hypothetical protein